MKQTRAEQLAKEIIHFTQNKIRNTQECINFAKEEIEMYFVEKDKSITQEEAKEIIGDNEKRFALFPYKKEFKVVNEFLIDLFKQKGIEIEIGKMKIHVGDIVKFYGKDMFENDEKILAFKIVIIKKIDSFQKNNPKSEFCLVEDADGHHYINHSSQVLFQRTNKKERDEFVSKYMANKI